MSVLFRGGSSSGGGGGCGGGGNDTGGRSGRLRTDRRGQ